MVMGTQEIIFAVTDEGKVIYTTVQEGYKEGIKWLHKLVTENLDRSGSIYTGMVYLCCKRKESPLWTLLHMGYC